MDEKLLFDNENIRKIKICAYNWDEIFKNRNLIYDAICDLLLDETNLFFYASQKESSKTLDETRKYIKKLMDNNILKENIFDIFNSIGWNKDKIDINNTIFQGDFAEYLMCIVIDKLNKFKTLISKVSLKTSPNMPSYGNDNIFFDYDDNILYYGESKFYQNAEDGLKASLNSLTKHSSITEIRFIRSHTNTFIAKNDEIRNKLIEKLEIVYPDEDNIKIKQISFIVNEDIWRKEDYEKILLKLYKTQENIFSNFTEIILIFLPVISKKELLEHFVERIKKYEQR